MDLDILVEMTDKNLYRIVEILKNEGCHIKYSADPIRILDEKVHKYLIENKNMKGD